VRIHIARRFALLMILAGTASMLEAADSPLQLRDPTMNHTTIVFSYAGDLWSVPREGGDARRLTTGPGTEATPHFSPDGTQIAFTGEYALHINDQTGLGPVEKVALGDMPAFYMSPVWSPDSKKVAYLDSHAGLWYINLEEKKPVLVDKDYYMSFGSMAASWSPDSKWLAYAKSLKSHMSATHLYSLAAAKNTQLTDGMSDASRPVFDKDGKFLYFAASTNSGPALEQDLQSSVRQVTRSLYLIVLSKDEKSPFLPESDEEKAQDEKKDEPKEDESQKDERAEKSVDVKIGFDNIGQRILALPMPARRYGNLQVGKAGTLFAVEVNVSRQAPSSLNVHRFDSSKRKSDTPFSGLRSFKASFSGEKVLLQTGDTWKIAAVPPLSDGPGGPPPADDKGTLKTEALEVRVDPVAEWKQIYHEVWRLECSILLPLSLCDPILETAARCRTWKSSPS
jgi:tricorn protease